MEIDRYVDRHIPLVTIAMPKRRPALNSQQYALTYRDAYYLYPCTDTPTRLATFEPFLPSSGQSYYAFLLIVSLIINTIEPQ
jgi:hypothetical protein